jgi:hypothetical protein
MGWASFRAILSQTHLVTLVQWQLGEEMRLLPGSFFL